MNKAADTKGRSIRKYAIILAGALIFYFVAKNACTSAYTMMVVDIALIYSLIAYGISVLLGMGGDLSFAGVAFMGGGSFFLANMTTGRLGFSIHPVLAFFLIIPVFAVISFLIGLILMRLKSTFFTFSTIALVQMAFTFYNNYKPLFGGADGVSGIPWLTLFGTRIANYYQWLPILLTISVVCGLFVERIRSTQLGRSLASCRDNETAARILGVNVYLTRVIGFTIAGVLSALAGGLYALLTKFASADMFTYASSTKYIIMSMLGGVQSTVGVFFGAVIVQIIPQVLKAFDKYLQLFWGISIVLLMIFMPEGLAGIVKMISEKIRKKGRKTANTANTAQKGGK